VAATGGKLNVSHRLCTRMVPHSHISTIVTPHKHLLLYICPSFSCSGIDGTVYTSASVTLSFPLRATMAAPVPSLHKFEHEGRTVYEWSQSLDEVNVVLRPPPGVTAKVLAIAITPTHVTIGIKGNPPFLSVRQCACLGSTWCDSLAECSCCRSNWPTIVSQRNPCGPLVWAALPSPSITCLA
jgi:hypothetical protein